MNRVIKGCVLVAGLLTMALSPLAQVSAAPFQGVTQNTAQNIAPNTTYGQETTTAYDNIEQVRHRGRHHYNDRYNNRHNRYKKQRRHRNNRHCYYSPRRGTMVCQPRYRHHW